MGMVESKATIRATEWYYDFGNREQAIRTLQTIRDSMLAIHKKADPQDMRPPWAITGLELRIQGSTFQRAEGLLYGIQQPTGHNRQSRTKQAAKWVHAPRAVTPKDRTENAINIVNCGRCVRGQDNRCEIRDS